jgi:electron transport complex protein RnfC
VWPLPGGIHPDDQKTLSNQTPIQSLPLPKIFILPLKQHIGQAAVPEVSVGESVGKGQRLASASGYISAHVHAPTSGKIIAMEDRAVPHPSGLLAPCLVLEADGEERWQQPPQFCQFWESQPPSVLRQRIRDAGIVGLGGAAFPTSVKVNASSPIHTVMVNAAECEPYITCDDRFLREQPEALLRGMAVLQKLLQPQQFLLGIEDNKPEALAALRQAFASAEFSHLPLKIQVVPTVYPAGGEKQLIYQLTGKEVPSGQHASSLGILGLNVATVAAIAEAVLWQKPLLSRVVTVSGAVKQPGNFEVLLGTPFAEVIAAAGGALPGQQRVIMGGPLNGFAVESTAVPVVKGTNCILLLPEKSAAPELPCIRCGACMEVCPAKLLPQQLYWHARARDLEAAKENRLFDCIECGACAYVCPSHIPLVQYYRAAKQELTQQYRDKQQAQVAKARFEFRSARLAQEKAEREAKLAAKRRTLEEQQATDTEKQQAIQEALARVRAKKMQQATVKPESGDGDAA